MNKDEFRLRQAVMDDCRRIFDIRNREEVRVNSFDNSIIDFAEHEAWYKDLLANKHRDLLVLEGANGIVGVLRFDINSMQAEVSLYMAPEYFGAGLGTKTLADGQIWLKNKRPHIKKLVARILADNEVSKGLFAKAGFVEAGENWSKRI